MKIKLVFSDWQSTISEPPKNKLSTRVFRGGLTLNAHIDLDAWQEKELREALKKGYQPVFWVRL